ncbi:MAG: S41 family peptidase [Pirellulaceae bacterium]
MRENTDSSPMPAKLRRRYRRWIGLIAASAIAILVASIFLGFWPLSLFIQDPWDAIPKASPEEIAKLHQPDALRADLDEIIALHERTCPNPYLRVSKKSILALAERLKASIDRPMTRREFLPIVMEMQAGYRCDHYLQRIPREDMVAALARGEGFLPFQAEPRGDALVVIAVTAEEEAIEPGDTIVQIGSVSAADHLARLRSLVPAETSRSRDAGIRRSFQALNWVAGVSVPTDVELVRPDGSRHIVTVEAVGKREINRTLPRASLPKASPASQGEVLVDTPPFRCLLLPGDQSDAPPIAFIDFPSMDHMLGGKWDGFIDQAMTAVNARGAAGLIVDIRENPGGTILGDDLLARVTDRPFRGMSRIVTRRSAESDEMMRLAVKPMWRWLLIGVVLPLYMPEYVALEHGEDSIAKIPVKSPTRIEPRFDGPTCLLIGDGTYSAAVVLADAARTYDMMLTIGEPTGGCPNQIGHICPFQLPNSRIVVDCAQRVYLRASGDETDVGPVRPHIEVAPIPGRDAALERAIEEIRKMQAERKQ